MAETGLQHGYCVTGLQRSPSYTGCMNAQPDHEQHTTKHAGLPRRAIRPGHPRRAAAIAAVLAGVALLAAACGGGSAPAATTSAGQAGSTTTGNSDEMPYTDCMRAHGVPSFPDPNAQGKPFTAQNLQQADIQPDSPQFQAASTACAHLLVPPSPAQLAQQTSELVRYAACMRAHGVPDFPDPSISPTGYPSLMLPQSAADSPDFQPAEQACHSVDPGLPVPRTSGKPGPGGAQAGAP
jgi:hypothetical protein